MLPRTDLSLTSNAITSSTFLLSSIDGAELIKKIIQTKQQKNKITTKQQQTGSCM